MRGNWSREPCTECGNEGLASRGAEIVSQEDYVCDECMVYARAYADGQAASDAEILSMAQKIDVQELDDYAPQRSPVSISTIRSLARLVRRITR